MTYFIGMWKCNLIGKSWSHIGLMNNYRYFISVGSQDNWDTDKSAFGKYNIRLVIFYKFLCFKKSFYDTKRVGKVFGRHISPELAGGYTDIIDS